MENSEEIKVTHYTGEEIVCKVARRISNENGDFYLMPHEACNVLHPSRYREHAADCVISYIHINHLQRTLSVFAKYRENGKWGGDSFKINCKRVVIGNEVYQNQ
jgi:hypothetical protein